MLIKMMESKLSEGLSTRGAQANNCLKNVLNKLEDAKKAIVSLVEPGEYSSDIHSSDLEVLSSLVDDCKSVLASINSDFQLYTGRILNPSKPINESLSKIPQGTQVVVGSDLTLDMDYYEADGSDKIQEAISEMVDKLMNSGRYDGDTDCICINVTIGDKEELLEY